MKFLDYLQESYVGRYVDWEIFVNPDAKEIRSFNWGVRFIADDRTKKFFVGSNRVLHEFFVNYLRSLKLLGITDKCFMGTGFVHGSKIQFADFSYDWGAPEDMNEFIWTRNYFTPESIKRLWK